MNEAPVENIYTTDFCQPDRSMDGARRVQPVCFDYLSDTEHVATVENDENNKIKTTTILHARDFWHYLEDAAQVPAGDNHFHSLLTYTFLQFLQGPRLSGQQEASSAAGFRPTEERHYFRQNSQMFTPWGCENQCDIRGKRGQLYEHKANRSDCTDDRAILRGTHRLLHAGRHTQTRLLRRVHSGGLHGSGQYLRL